MQARRFASMFVVVGLALNISVFAQRSNQSYQKWEYKIVNTCSNEFQETDIQKLGEEGWELVDTDLANCYRGYYFKRPVRNGVKPSATPPKPAAPQCTLPVEKAPVIRGLRLGMSLEELWKLFPDRAEQPEVKDVLKDVDKPPRYGAANLSFSTPQRPDQESIFDGISGFNFIVLDGRVKEISIRYTGTQRSTPFWTPEGFITQISQTFSLPGIENWSGKSSQRKITCAGFELSISLRGYVDSRGILPVEYSNPTISLADTTYKKIIQQRIENDQQKQRQAFKF